MAQYISKALETTAAVQAATVHFTNGGLGRIITGIDYISRYNSGILSNDLTSSQYVEVGGSRRKILKEECERAYFAAGNFAYAANVEYESYTYTDHLPSLECLRKCTRIAQSIAILGSGDVSRGTQSNHSAYLETLDFASATLGAFVVIYSNFSFPEAKADYYVGNIEQGFSEIQAGIKDTESAIRKELSSQVNT